MDDAKNYTFDDILQEMRTVIAKGGTNEQIVAAFCKKSAIVADFLRFLAQENRIGANGSVNASQRIAKYNSYRYGIPLDMMAFPDVDKNHIAMFYKIDDMIFIKVFKLPDVERERYDEFRRLKKAIAEEQDDERNAQAD